MGMNKSKNNHGFTLGELLIVVGIIAVLVAISIPIFNKQLEKARDAASIANIRSTYSYFPEAYLKLEMEQPVDHTVKIDGMGYWARNYYPDGKIWTISTSGFTVDIQSKKKNNWSGLGKNLPFKWVNPQTSCDNGIPGKYRMTVTYNEDGSTRCVEVYKY